MSSTASTPGLVSFGEARRIVENQAALVGASRADIGDIETTTLLAGRGRVLAEPLIADRDFPPFPRATRDGYAVRAANVQQVPARLALIGEIKAGDPPHSFPIDHGQAVSIMTGAPLPHGADAVVMVEYTADVSQPDGRFVEIQRTVNAGENFVPRAAEARSGQLLVERGRRLNHSLIAIAASVGKSSVKVCCKPRVAVLSTGDEIVPIDATPGPSHIRNSNSYSLAAQIEEAGAIPVPLAIAPDEPKRLLELMEEGLSCDLLLITGGVSMGKYDLVEQVLAEMNAEFYFTGARIQPGKPVVFGSLPQPPSLPVRAATPPGQKKYFFGLPGNPVSTMVTFRLFAQPMIDALSTARPEPLRFLKARLKSDVHTKPGLTRFLPALLSGEFENAEVSLAPWQGSGDIAALSRANCYLVIPPAREHMEAGVFASVLPM